MVETKRPITNDIRYSASNDHALPINTSNASNVSACT